MLRRIRGLFRSVAASTNVFSLCFAVSQKRRRRTCGVPLHVLVTLIR
jgi:hypothetical protein